MPRRRRRWVRRGSPLFQICRRRQAQAAYRVRSTRLLLYRAATRRGSTNLFPMGPIWRRQIEADVTASYVLSPLRAGSICSPRSSRVSPRRGVAKPPSGRSFAIRPAPTFRLSRRISCSASQIRTSRVGRATAMKPGIGKGREARRLRNDPRGRRSGELGSDTGRSPQQCANRPFYARSDDRNIAAARSRRGASRRLLWTRAENAVESGRSHRLVDQQAARHSGSNVRRTREPGERQSNVPPLSSDGFSSGRYTKYPSASPLFDNLDSRSASARSCSGGSPTPW